MEQLGTVGVDLAKNVFQVHGVSESGDIVGRREPRRGQVLAFFPWIRPCLIGMEACSGAHDRARGLISSGHEVRLMVSRDRGPGGAAKARRTSYVKPHVKQGKTDRADAEAIEAVTRPTMRFVPVKPAERQAALLDHKTRDFLLRQQTQIVHAIRAHLAEFEPRGRWFGRNAPLERFVRASPHPSPGVVAKGIHSEAGTKPIR